MTDTRNYETWLEQGADNAETRANGIWKQLLREYEKPPIDPAIEQELAEFVARRKREIAGTRGKAGTSGA